MRTIWLISTLLFTACATTKAEVTPVQITSVTQIKSEPFDPAETLDEAEEYFTAENYTGALQEYSRLLSFDPDHVSAKLGAGESLLALGKFKNAAQIFWDNDFEGLDPEDLERVKIGQILSGVQTDRYEKPETAIHDGFLVRSDDARLWNAKGRLHDNQGEWMESLFSYVTALDIGQLRSGTINNMGMSLLLQGRHKEALNKFYQAVSLSPDTQIYDNNLRMTHILLGDYINALNDVTETRASNLFNDAGYVAMQSGQDQLAEIFFTKALQISPVHHSKAQANLDSMVSLGLANTP